MENKLRHQERKFVIQVPEDHVLSAILPAYLWLRILSSTVMATNSFSNSYWPQGSLCGSRFMIPDAAKLNSIVGCVEVEFGLFQCFRIWLN